jgi:hypothetical protein
MALIPAGRPLTGYLHRYPKEAPSHEVPGPALNRRIRSPTQQLARFVRIPPRSRGRAASRLGQIPGAARSRSPQPPRLLNSRRSWRGPVQPNRRPASPVASPLPLLCGYGTVVQPASARSSSMIVARPSTTITAAAMYPRIGWGIGRPPRRARSTLCQRRRASRCHHAGQDERDPDQLPRPEDAPGWKDPFGGHAGDHQGQPSAKPRQIGPLIGEFGLGIGPAPSRTTAILPLRPCPRDSSYQGATDLPLLEGQYLPSYLTLRGRDF